MARVRQPYDEPRMVPWIGRTVDPGEIVEVPDRDLPSYLEAGWTPARDQETQRVVKKLDQEPDAGEKGA